MSEAGSKRGSAAPASTNGAEKTANNDAMEVDTPVNDPVPAAAEPISAEQVEDAGDVENAVTAVEATESVSSGSKEKTQTNGKQKEQVAHDENEDAEEGDEDGSELDEGEFEIENILDHKKTGGKGKAGFEYLVSWVGYGPEFNEWVREDNFGSHELIDSYWSKMGGKPSKKAQTPMTGSKRRRGSSSPPHNTASKRSTRKKDDEEDDAQVGQYATEYKDSMAPYADWKNWEECVDKVETVERGANEKLTVYLLMTGGEKCAQPVAVANARCPQKMLKFYESHLKWRSVK